jgi:hypothetical protein
MMQLTCRSIGLLKAAALEIGETSVTVATDSGVISFDFSRADETHARVLGYESQPTRQQLAAMLRLPLVPSVQ